jgi:hypothetical protein
MPSDRPVRLALELNPGACPISGALLHDGEPPREFHGTLDMLAAIEEARTAVAPDDVEATTGIEGR